MLKEIRRVYLALVKPNIDSLVYLSIGIGIPRRVQVKGTGFKAV
jgi:hypothetical protein